MAASSDDILQRILSQGDPNAPGLLGLINKGTAPFGGAGNLGLQLLANSGYSSTPRTTGQVLAQSALNAQQVAAGAQEQKLKEQLIAAQIRALNAKPSVNNPASVQEYEYAKANGFKGTFEEWQLKSRQQNDPAEVAAYKYFAALKPEEQQNFLRLKRNIGSDYQVVDVNGVPTVVYKPAAGYGANTPASATPLATPLSSVEQEAAGQSQIASSKTAAMKTAESKATAEFDLPRVQQNVQQALSDIDKLKGHPGLPYITGLASKVPVVPGTDQAAAAALANQVQGQTFLQAYQSLRGGGSITDVEGKKAEAAIGRLDRAQSTEDYKQALSDLQDVLKIGLARAQKQSGGKGGEERRVVGGKTYVRKDGKWYVDDGS